MRLLTITTAIMLLGTNAQALSPADKCEAAKLKIAGKYDFCRLKAESKAVKIGGAPDYSLCDLKYGGKWSSSETAGAGQCPSNGDQAAVQNFIIQHTDDLAGSLAGGPLPDCPGDLADALACGNSAIDAGEDCDQANLNGETCVTQGFVGGTLKCGSGCTFDIGGCSNTRFVDNGDGTVTDAQTGLMWEKKDDLGGIHDKDDVYTWSASGTAPDGTAFTTFIGTLNYSSSPVGSGPDDVGGCFAGHCDWRIPTSAELLTILVAPFPCGTDPCIDPVFGPTQSGSGKYWSSTTPSGGAIGAWTVHFIDGGYVGFLKTATAYVRAVRTGN